MQGPLSGILRAVNRPKDAKLNILTAPTHEAVETDLCGTGHLFFALQHPSFKKWNSAFRPVPWNYQILRGNSIEEQIKPDMKFDLVLAQNRFGQYQILSQIAASMNIPLITYEHTAPHPSWNEKMRAQVTSMRGDMNVFISEWSVDKWGFTHTDPRVRVINHGIDTDRFSGWRGGDGKILTVVNQYPQRDWACGWSLYQKLIKDLPANPIGDSPGFSRPARNEDHLIALYRNASVFLNTSQVSPIPHSLLEAMAVGCPVVTTATCMIPEIVIHGVNGYISNNEWELRKYLEELLKDHETARRMGENARRTICERFSVDRFCREWNEVFAQTAGTPASTWRHQSC